MPPSSDLAAGVRTAVLAFFETWMQQGIEGVEDAVAGIAEDFSGLGTGPGDYYTDRSDLRTLFQREKEGVPYPSTLEIPWMNVRMIRDTLGLVEGQLRSVIHADTTDYIVDPRFSLLVERRGGRWLLAHFHFSFADARQDEGDTLMELLEGRNRELEREVARRTAELEQSLRDLEAAQEQLIQQEKMASLGALTAGVAHEMKNPLNFINNFASLSRELMEELEAEDDPEEQAAILADIKSNAEKIEKHGRRADTIIRSMLDHARAGHREQRLVDLNALVAEYVDLAWHSKRSQYPDVSVGLSTDWGTHVGEANVASAEMGRVVLNLVSNAYDAVRERRHQEGEMFSPEITVTTRRTAQGVEIRVADNGPGIPADHQKRVFEPFFTTKPPGVGTGLGLSLSYDIVTQGHGGTLTIESEEGRGAALIVRLPHHDTAKEERNPAET